MNANLPSITLLLAMLATGLLAEVLPQPAQPPVGPGLEVIGPINRWEPEPDENLLAQIAGRIAANPLLDPKQITVEVKNGVATITGTVPSWTARNSVRRNAIESGAAGVINRLSVRAAEP